jgi:hypothetical protein
MMPMHRILERQLATTPTFDEFVIQAQSTRPCSSRWVCFGLEVMARASAAPFWQTAQGLEQSPPAPVFGSLYMAPLS